MKKILFGIALFLLLIGSVKGEELNLVEDGKSAIIIEPTTKEIIYQKNIHEKLMPASMTKMIGMLIVIENIENGNLKWEEIITASAHASSMGGSQIYLKAGEKMSVRDLFKGIAIASGNDATVALAERIAGTEELFVEMMNKKANELGLKNTVFKNSTGLDVANHYSTAYDMAIIASELVKHDEVLEYTGTYEDYLRQNTDNKFWLVNTNKLVRFYQGVDGLKTGYTKDAGYCLTATAQKNNMRLITVIMGSSASDKRNAETTKMLDYGFNMYSVEKMLDKTTVLGTIDVHNGDYEKVDIVPKNEVQILNNKTKEKRNVTYNIQLDKVEAPLKIGDKVGIIEILENNKTINTIDITVLNDVPKASFFKQYFRNIKKILIGETNL